MLRARSIASHMVTCMQVYDVWAFQIGPLHHCGTIPFVLAPIWCAPVAAA